MAGRVEKKAARPGVRALLFDGDGLRPVWRLVIALIAYAAATRLVRFGLSALFRAAFAAWNVNAETAWRAPGWARTLYVWQGSFVTLAVYLAAIALTLWLRRRLFGLGSLPKAMPAALLRAWLMGTGAAVMSGALFLLTDSFRPEWPLAAPRLTAGLIALWLISLLGALSVTLFCEALLYDGLRERWGGIGAGTACVIAFFLLSGGLSGSVLSAANVVLLGIAYLLVYEKRGLLACAGLNWGWSFALAFLLGFGGGDRAAYRLYAVSELWLTGGDAGFAYGLWLTLMLAIPLGIIGTKAIMRRKRAR